MNRYWLLCLVFSAMQAFPLAAQEPKSPAPPEGPRARGPAAPARPAAPPAAGELKKYDDVVTKDFVTQAGRGRQRPWRKQLGWRGLGGRSRSV